MFCRNCQTIIPDDSIFCENCGAPTGRVPDEIDEEQLIPEEAVEFVVDEEPVKATSVPVDPVWWEPPEDARAEESWADEDDWDDKPEEPAEEEPAPEEDAPAEEIPEEPEEEAPEESPEEEIPEETAEEPPTEETAEETSAEPAGEEPVSEEEPSEHNDAAETLKKLTGMAAGAAEQARPYAEKAKSMLKDLGKSVRTGTGWAADAAKEQYQQKKQEFEEKKEQREEQREEERKKREEQREEERKKREEQREEERKRREEQREEELKRREEERKRFEEELKRQEEERLRQEEERRQQEAERQAREKREEEEDLAQEPGFWYRGEIPESEEAGQEQTAALPAEEQETAEDPEVPEIPEIPEVPEAPEVPETAEDLAAAEDTEAGQPAEAEPAEAEHADAEPVIEEAAEPEPEIETPSEEHIEDKLADTARFTWSGSELEKAVNGQAGEEGTEEASDFTVPPLEIEDQEPAEEDEPAIYRIKDYAADRKRKPALQIRKKHWIIIAIIVALIIGIAATAHYMVQQAKEQQELEAAYQASVKQATQLAGEQKYADAEVLYLQLMQQRPEDMRLYVGLAQMYMEQQRYVDAKALIKRAEEVTGDEETFAQMKKDIKVLTSTKWKKQYIKVLEEYEAEIKSYEEDVTASVAVCDVNGDMKPELFFFTKEYYGYGKLHIYTTVDNKAKEVTYECKNRGTQYEDAFYDVSSDDSSYAIFNSKEDGQFSIYANIIHGNDSWDSTNMYKLNLKGGCKRIDLIEGSIDTTYHEGEDDDSEYLRNGEDIDYDTYIAEFKKVLEGAQQVILYNGTGGDQSVWTKIKPDSVMCMPYDSLMVDLEAK